MNELLRPKAADILLAAVLMCCAVALLVIWFSSPQALADDKRYSALTLVFPLADIAVAAALLFKCGFFRWFSLTGIIARLKGIDRKRVYPTEMYITSVKVFALLFSLANVILVIFVIRIII